MPYCRKCVKANSSTTGRHPLGWPQRCSSTVCTIFLAIICGLHVALTEVAATWIDGNFQLFSLTSVDERKSCIKIDYKYLPRFKKFSSLPWKWKESVAWTRRLRFVYCYWSLLHFYALAFLTERHTVAHFADCRTMSYGRFLDKCEISVKINF